MTWAGWLASPPSYLVIVGAMAAGLAAAYGRELEASRQPNGSWWVRRLLVLPMLVIAATAATDLLNLPVSVSALTAAMLALGGYDALCLLESKWRHRLEQPHAGAHGHEPPSAK